jgi:glycosyltransferase involved in cell wall biosynthesis
MKLLIAIPALNEEASIENIIQRCLDARDEIIGNSYITEVQITVVSDGSTDRTSELAHRHTDKIQLTVFEENRGYGAAIQHAWQDSDADLLAFLDADGTCDPRFFANLARTLQDEHADVVLGCRLNAETKMPQLRQTGNLLFAGLLTLLSGRRIRDTASGMRIVRREAYNRLRPLPNGLHFTPAMSARALLDLEAHTKLVEIDMPYHERIGDSKLKAGRDGLRFLGVITKTALIYRPVRLATLLLTTGMLTLGVSLFFLRDLQNERHPSPVKNPTNRKSVSSFVSVE